VVSPHRLVSACRTTDYLQLHDICNIPTTRLYLVFYGHSAAKSSATKKAKTYNSGYSPVVTHLTTNPPVHCLSTAERTGSSIFSVLWSYVKDEDDCTVYNLTVTFMNSGITQPSGRQRQYHFLYYLVLLHSCPTFFVDSYK
jgi:hypothetical protein